MKQTYDEQQDQALFDAGFLAALRYARDHAFDDYGDGFTVHVNWLDQEIQAYQEEAA